MSMTGKDYQAIAARLRNLAITIHEAPGPIEDYQSGLLDGLRAAAHQLAAYAAKNPHFDREKFLAACFPVE